ncbi:hypothetical protein H4R26_004521 [Coemansia thaxteri]|uniref:DH domain-containing protein n=1 Tax=Coemansia thaxteri TaxID=2663907 RepID=A0A9W8BG38_9FUNG|nr:hypothetical protein H4R26_004521 [Coemansia thaxteri]
MAKSKLLTRATPKQATNGSEFDADSGSAARPRTAGGERGILQRLRIGRLFFGLGSGSGYSNPGFASASAEDASAGTGFGVAMPHSARCNFRTSSDHSLATTGDLLPSALHTSSMSFLIGAPPQTTAHDECAVGNGTQTISYLHRQHVGSFVPQAAANRMSRYSMMSRRLSAPDGTEVARRLSRVSIASNRALVLRSSTESLPDALVDVSSYTGSVHSECLLEPITCSSDCELDRSSSAAPLANAKVFSSSENFPMTSESSRGLQADASSDAIARQSLRDGALSMHRRNSQDEFIPMPSSAPMSVPALALPQPSDNSSAANKSQEGHDDGPSMGNALLSRDRGVMLSGRAARDELLPPHHNRSFDYEDTFRQTPTLAVSSPASEGASLDVRRRALSPHGLRQHRLGESASMHNHFRHLSPRSDPPPSLSLPTSPSTYAQHVSPLLLLPRDELATQSSLGASCHMGGVASDSSGLPVLLMGSVKQRGDKKIARQSGNVSGNRSVSATQSSPHSTSSSLGLVDTNATSAQPAAAPGSGPWSPYQISLEALVAGSSDSLCTDSGSAQNTSAPSPVTEMALQTTDACSSADLVSASRGNDDEVRSPPPSLRPKSLFEGATHSGNRCSLVSEEGVSTLHTSSSIESARAFLAMIATSHACDSAAATSNPTSIAVVASDVQNDFECLTFVNNMRSPTPASAPITSTPSEYTTTDLAANVAHGTDTQPLPQEHALCAQPSAVASAYTEAELSQPTLPGVLGNRSLRVRSRLASVGIRRASTYVWTRSSVFMRSLSSAEELNSGQHSRSVDTVADTVGADSGSETAQESAGTSGTPSHNSESASMGVEPTKTDPETFTPPAPVPLPVVKTPPAVMRLHAARELVMTEKNFVDNLFVIKKVWMEPVFSSANSPKPIIPYQTARIIFYGIAALHSHASQFYREMDYILGSFERSHSAMEIVNDDGMRIGNMFRTSDRHWDDFIAYVRNYGTAVNCLKQLQDYKPYLRYHEDCMAQKRTNRQSLKDLLMLPIQRITRYTLLLKNILKHTPAVHSDHIELCRAVKNVTHFASIVNECRRKQEEMYRLIDIFRTIENCPVLPHSDSRLFISEFVVRELISRLPIRLLLFTDMVIVTQAPAHSKLDDVGLIDSTVEWTYHGLAFLDRIEVQNAGESTNTLITILSLNRGSTDTGSLDTCRHSLPSASEPAVSSCASGIGSIAQASSQSSTHDRSETFEPYSRASAGSQGSGVNAPKANNKLMLEHGPADLGTHKKKGRGRKGILRVNSRDSIPDHIAALSRSTFPSPVPSPARLERSASRLNCSSYIATDTTTDRDIFASSHLRPKTASGSSGASLSGSSQPGSFLHTSSATLAGYTNPMQAESSAPCRPLLPDVASGGSSGASGYGTGRADVAPLQLIQLTLVMQHATSAARKQFVRALKDATARYTRELESCNIESDAGADFLAADDGSDVLNLHPL